MNSAGSPLGGGVFPCMSDGNTSWKPELGRLATVHFWKVAGCPAIILARSSAKMSRPPEPALTPIKYDPPFPFWGQTPYFG